MNKLDVFLGVCLVVIASNAIYDTWVVKPKFMESNRVLTNALNESIKSRRESIEQFKNVDDSLRLNIEYLKRNNYVQ